MSSWPKTDSRGSNILHLPVAQAAAPPAGAAEFEIWDLHGHLNGVGELTAHQRAAKLIKDADRLGVDRLVFFLGVPIRAQIQYDEPFQRGVTC